MRSLLILFLLPALSLSADDAWIPGPCPSESATQRAAFEKGMLAADPGDPLYLPHPFPRTSEQAVEDFLFAHRRAVASADPMRKGDARLFDTVDAGDARFVVVRVANWTPARCGAPFGQTDFHYLVRVFDKTRGEEITRASVAESGRVYQLIHRPEDPEQASFTMKELPKLTVPASLQAPRNVQYVQTWGQLKCPALKPCIAFRSGGRSYLAREGVVYRLEVEAPVSFRTDLGSPGARKAFLSTLAEKPGALVSVGGDHAAIAVPVEP